MKLLAPCDEGDIDEVADVPLARAQRLKEVGAARPADRDAATTLDAVYFGP